MRERLRRLPTTVQEQTRGLVDVWELSRGAGATVAVVDEDAGACSHPEFTGRVRATGVVFPAEAADGGVSRSHGTKVAGLAAGGGPHAMGVAPAAFLLPVAVPALSKTTGSRDEADALRWSADHGADVICCAWAPRAGTTDSGWLPPHTRAALDYCLTRGRDGKGCVIVVSAGNDGTDVALNGYATYSGVIAVGACNYHGQHPSYSGWGDALWCVFPSNDPRDPTGAGMTYLTTAPIGSLLDGDAFYTTRFGFTSAATAAVAGICALIVSANPDLTAQDVKVVLRDSCEKIDAESGTYDERGHSPVYGFGRPDIARAVELAHERRCPASG